MARKSASGGRVKPILVKEKGVKASSEWKDPERIVSGRKVFRSASLAGSRKRAFGDVVTFVTAADPIERVGLERLGVPAVLVREMADEMKISAVRLYDILGVPKATATRRAAAGQRIGGAGGHAAVAMLRLIGEVHAMVAESTSAEVGKFDAAEWLGQWIERPQPALAGQKPADLLDTPTGVEVVSRSLGSILSGAYQ